MRQATTSSSAMVREQSEFAARVQMHRERMNASQKKIADYLLSDEQACLELSIYQIAENIGMSVATVTRFCQMLGYRGLADMKFHIQQREVTLGGGDIGIGRGDDINTIKQKALQFNQRSMRDCIINMDNDALDEAVGLVAGARYVLFCGMGSASGIAGAAAGLFLSMGISAGFVSDGLLQLRTSAMLGEGSVVIAISYDGLSKDTGDSLMTAKSKGVKTILLTSLKDTLLGKYADVVLYTPARAGGNALNIASTSLCQLAILHTILAGTVTRYYDRFQEKSREQMRLSNMKRYALKQKEILTQRVAQ